MLITLYFADEESSGCGEEARGEAPSGGGGGGNNAMSGQERLAGMHAALHAQLASQLAQQQAALAAAVAAAQHHHHQNNNVIGEYVHELVIVEEPGLILE